MNRTAPVAARRSLTVGAGLGAIVAVVAVVAFSGGGTQRPAAVTSPAAGHGSPAGHQAQLTGRKPVQQTALHWGSFFGARKGNYDLRKSPAPVMVPGKIAEVGSSNSTEYALLTDGRLYAWGLGTHGQLGNDHTKNSFTKAVRVRFPAGVKIKSIPVDVMPYDTALAIDESGHVWGWGENGGGELCRGLVKSYSTPVRLPFTNVSVTAGASNHALYDANGKVYACGQNVAGDLGDGSRGNSTRPRPVPKLSGRRDGATVTGLYASFANSGALLSDGTYYDWGYDGAGQLGNGHPDKSSDVPVKVTLPGPATQVALGGSIWNNGQTLVMLANGAMYSWGNDRAGQLGDGQVRAEPAPVPFSAPLGVVYRSLASGSATSYAISTTGDVYAWGVSHVGQLGDGTTKTSRKPVLILAGAVSISATANNVVVSVPERLCHQLWCMSEAGGWLSVQPAG
jgi:alpha-tubulin suppressor-like RCC1 family protein